MCTWHTHTHIYIYTNTHTHIYTNTHTLCYLFTKLNRNKLYIYASTLQHRPSHYFEHVADERWWSNTNDLSSKHSLSPHKDKLATKPNLYNPFDSCTHTSHSSAGLLPSTTVCIQAVFNAVVSCVSVCIIPTLIGTLTKDKSGLVVPLCLTSHFSSPEWKGSEAKQDEMQQEIYYCYDLCLLMVTLCNYYTSSLKGH